jgi:hypothetical protein
MNNSIYCRYYQAYIKKDSVWHFTSVLRSIEHLAFDRTFDVEASIFEFFVTEGCVEDFLAIMCYFERLGIVTSLQNLPNRFAE